MNVGGLLGAGTTGETFGITVAWALLGPGLSGSAALRSILTATLCKTSPMLS